ncbi:MAG: hypothetical protein ACK40O_06955 [Allosphingosinicella sp.]
MRYALLLLAAAIAMPAVAAEKDTPKAAAAEQSAEKPQKKVKPKKICRESHDTTSRMGGGRLCLTAEQWAERDKQGRAGSSRSAKSDSANN